MEYLYIVCAGLLIFFSISLWSKKNKPLSEKIYSWWIVALLVTVISFFLYAKGLSREFPIFITLICDTHLLHGAFLYLYVRSFTDNQFHLKAVHLWHLSPMLFQIFGKIVLNYVFNVMECYESGGCQEDENIFVTITYIYKYLILGGYILFTWRLITDYRNKARLPRDQMRGEWVRQIGLGVTFLYFGVLLIQAGRYTFPELFWERMLLGNTLTTLFIFIFLYLGNSYAYLFVVPSKTRFINLSESFDNSSCKYNVDREELNSVMERLNTIMEQQKVFTKPQLTLKEFSEISGLPVVTISQVVNSATNRSFTDYVNSYRVNMLKSMMDDPKYRNYKIMALAIDCGFASKTTLIRIFRQHTGMTPGEYLNKPEEEL